MKLFRSFTLTRPALPPVSNWLRRLEPISSRLKHWNEQRLRGAETPVARLGDWRSPLRKGYLFIAVTVGVGGIWSATARLDSAVVALGSVAVDGNRKAIQHLEGGIVESIAVQDGAEVKDGEVLLRLRATQAKAQRGVAELAVLQALGEEARLVAEADRKDRISFPNELTRGTEYNEALRTMLDQERQFREREAARLMEVSILNERQAQSGKQYESTQSQRNATSIQADSIADELAKLRPLANQGYVTASRVNPLQRSLTDLQGRVGSLDADLARLSGNNEEIRLQIDQVGRRYVEEASGKLAETRLKLAEAREKLRVAEDVLSRMEIRSPRAGRIVGSKVHTVGAVVKPGETLMEIVPEDEDLVVVAKISTMDVNHIYSGMSAEVRFPAFKGRATPFAIGEVKSVGADALPDDMTRQMSYELRIGVRSSDLSAKIRGRLRPGMPAEVFVPTGERTAIAYLMQPLLDAFRSSLREE